MADRIWFCWSPDLGSDVSDARQIKAYAPELAAEFWARREDAESADYWIVSGDGATVCVAKDAAGTDTLSFRVSGEQCINYSARAIVGGTTSATKEPQP